MQKAPLPGLSAYRDCRMGNNAKLYGQLIVNKKAVPHLLPGIKGRSRQIEVISGQIFYLQEGRGAFIQNPEKRTGVYRDS